jgi:hypothetical protein
MVRGLEEGRSAVRADDGRLQPHAHAHLGTGVPGGGKNEEKTVKSSSENRCKPRSKQPNFAYCPLKNQKKCAHAGSMRLVW